MKNACSLTFNSLICGYKKMQSGLMSSVKALSSHGMSSITPGNFILLQFKMSLVTQVGESISNMISQVNSMINVALRNQKPQ